MTCSADSFAGSVEAAHSALAFNRQELLHRHTVLRDRPLEVAMHQLAARSAELPKPKLKPPPRGPRGRQHRHQGCESGLAYFCSGSHGVALACWRVSSGRERHDRRILIIELHHCSGMGHGGQIDRIPVRQPDTTMRYRFSDSVGFGRAMNSIR